MTDRFFVPNTLLGLGVSQAQYGVTCGLLDIPDRREVHCISGEMVSTTLFVPGWMALHKMWIGAKKAGVFLSVLRICLGCVPRGIVV